MAFAALTAPAAAQGTGRDTAQKLPMVTVTASRSESAILTTPLAVSKITTATLRTVTGFGLDEALSKVPGVLAQSRYGTSDVRIVIRGFGARGAGDRSNAGTSRGVRFLIDGIPETEPDGRTSFDNMDMAAASAVEVLRSNSSVIWGNAAGGVINVLTPIWSDKTTLELQPMTGSFGMKRLAMRWSTPVGTGTAYTSFTNTVSDGWRTHSSARRALLNAGFAGNLGDKTKVAVYATGANNLSHLPGALTQSQYDADPTQANAAYVTRDERRYNRVLRLGATIDHEISNNASVSSMVFLNPKYLQRSERNSFRDFTRYHVGGNVVGRLNVGSNRFTAGIDEAYQDGAIMFYSLVNGGRGPTLNADKAEGANNTGAFAQDEVRIGEKMLLTLGARYDNVSYYYKNFMDPAIDPTPDGSRSFNQVTPKLGFVLKLGATRSAYANLGGGIEVPAGNETDPYGAQGNVAINPLLEPIRTTTVEAGFKSVSENAGPFRLTGDLAVYNTEIKNDLQPYNEGRFYMSAGKSRRTGVELGVTGETKGGIFASLAFTASRNRYLDYTVDSSLFKSGGQKAVFNGNQIPGIAGVMAQAELGAELPGVRSVRVKVGVEHSGKYFADDGNLVNVPAYTIINLTAELRKPIITANGWGVRGFITVHNVADTKYVGSAFLNPLYNASREALAFEPGMPQSVMLSLSVGRLQ
jgi:iron complex outermembrane receptor protein